MTRNEAFPSVMLVMIDATRTDRLSCYGYDRPTTPNIDKIASEGVLYEQAFAPDVWTLPVMSSVFTGLVPHDHGVTFQRPRLASHHVTLAGLLAEQGYVTWGASAVPWIGRATGLDRGFSEFWEAYRLLKGRAPSKVAELINRFYAKYIFQRYGRGARRITQAVIRRLQAKQSNHAHSPFFMFVHYMEPHYPHNPPKPYDALFFEDRQLLARAKKINHHPLDFFAGKIVLNEEDFELLNNLYDAEITYMDAQLGQLYRALEELGLLDTTAIVLFADHGENIGDHGLLDHHFCLYDSLIHVPLIVRYPPQFARGERIEELITTTDIFRTILELAGLGDDQIPGNTRSLRVEDVRASPRDYITAETTGEFLRAIEKRKPVRDLSHYDRKLRAVRTSRYKYIEGSDGSMELYDLRSDPDEQCNLANERPNDLARLQRILRREFQMRVESQDSEKSGSIIDDSIVVERLRSLGYID